MSGWLAIFEDCLSVKGLPTSTISAAISRMMENRHKILREVISSEFRQGNFERADEDALVSVFYRLIRDAQEGVAKNNLRLMARLVNGMAEKQELKAPSFLRYATVLSSLTPDEIRILAVMARFKDEVLTKDAVKATLVKDKRHLALLEVAPQAEEHLQALIRTGLVIMRSHTIGDISDGTHKFQLTNFMNEILRYIQTIPEFERE